MKKEITTAEELMDAINNGTVLLGWENEPSTIGDKIYRHMYIERLKELIRENNLPFTITEK